MRIATVQAEPAFMHSEIEFDFLRIISTQMDLKGLIYLGGFGCGQNPLNGVSSYQKTLHMDMVM